MWLLPLLYEDDISETPINPSFTSTLLNLTLTPRHFPHFGLPCRGSSGIATISELIVRTSEYLFSVGFFSNPWHSAHSLNYVAQLGWSGMVPCQKRMASQAVIRPYDDLHGAKGRQYIRSSHGTTLQYPHIYIGSLDGLWRSSDRGQRNYMENPLC